MDNWSNSMGNSGNLDFTEYCTSVTWPMITIKNTWEYYYRGKINRATAIKRLQMLGLSTADIKEIMAAWDNSIARMKRKI